MLIELKYPNDSPLRITATTKETETTFIFTVANSYGIDERDRFEKVCMVSDM